ncbi:MAG TPA: hypothetical protein VGK67_27695 [Myxococcales bacterium]|jgi:hypothetical protein
MTLVLILLVVFGGALVLAIGIIGAVERSSQRHLARAEEEERQALEGGRRRAAPRLSPAETRQLDAELREVLAAEAAPSSSMPATATAGLQLYRMDVRGQVRILEDGGRTVVERLPQTPHGETPKGAWAKDGHLFVVGYQYTGAPGEDTGTLWHRLPDGCWQVEWRSEERLIVSVVGDRVDDLWAVGSRCLVHYDGKAWREAELPPLGDRKGLSSAWQSPRGELFVPTYDGRIFRRGVDGAWVQELDMGGGQLLAIVGRGEEIVCCGDSGQIRRRLPDGTWASEESGVNSQLRVALARPEGLYLAGGTHLLFSNAPGSWKPMAGAPLWIRSLCARSDGFLVACNGDTLVQRPGAWQTVWKGGGELAVADGAALYVVELLEKRIDG